MRAALEAGRGRMLLGGHPQDAVLDLLTQVLDGCGAALVAATLRGVLAARPIRLLCPHCKQAGPGTAGTPGPGAASAPGCEACGLTGFQGQRLLTEVWLPDEDDRMMLRTGRQAAVLERVAAATGTQMRAQGRALVEDGLTAPEELARVLEGDLWTSPTSCSSQRSAKPPTCTSARARRRPCASTGGWCAWTGCRSLAKRSTPCSTIFWPTSRRPASKPRTISTLPSNWSTWAAFA